MPSDWSFVTAYDDVEFLGGSQTRDVLVTGIVTSPSGIYGEVRVPKSEFDQYGEQVVRAAAATFVTIFETLAAQPFISGVQWGMAAHNGQLRDVAVLTVTSSSGNSSSVLTIPVVELTPDLDHAAVKKLHDRLDALEHS